MRILFDSQKTEYKSPFGTLTPNQICRLHIHIPVTVDPRQVAIIVTREDGTAYREFPMTEKTRQDAYAIWQGDIAFPYPGLFFYYFRITGKTGTFRLFKAGSDTNMEAGDKWQISCIAEDFTTPDWAKGAVIYQVFPDRFCKAGECDLTDKLTPYVLHEHWDEEVFWQPTAKGEVLNNDFYGGNFQGIREKLPYLKSLGVNILYLNPISKSFSSHRYDTGDYKTPDPMLGTTQDFKALCDAAHDLDIRVILDGVFSHTGSDSLYFDRNKTFGGNGAYCSPDSPYYNWYTFYSYPDSYLSWWGFDTLPTVNKLCPEFIRYIITDDDSVVAHWLGLGADGFRLDVADELPNEFLYLLKNRVREINPNALVMGEVWEDASNKIAYDIRRRYFVDSTLDSVMNYPFRKAVMDFVKGADDGQSFARQVMTITENYPPQVLSCCMNLLGSHDTPRILTALVDDYDGPREILAQRKLAEAQIAHALEKLKMATFLQYMLPGSPSIYYGDEVQMEGAKDPFNRRPYPWGRENKELQSHFAALGKVKNAYAPLKTGNIRFVENAGGRLHFTRTLDGETLHIYLNTSPTAWQLPQSLPCVKGGGTANAVTEGLSNETLPLLSHRLSENGTLLSGGFCVMQN